MRIVVQPLTFDTLGDLAGTAATSMFWTVEPGEAEAREKEGNVRIDKELWLHNTLTNWGPCGFTAYVTSGTSEETAVPAATVIFAPPSMLPGCKVFPTAPVSGDAVLISTVHVRSAFAGLFLENRLLDAAVDELSRRGVRAVECFGRRVLTQTAQTAQHDGSTSTVDAGRAETPDRASKPGKAGNADQAARADEPRLLVPRHAPILWAETLEDQGFKVIDDHEEFPRYRMELDSTANLFAAVEESLWEATVTMGMGMKEGMGAHSH